MRDDPALIWAAVSVVLVPAPDAVLLIRRAERAGDPWSGHMALPGGRQEPADADLVETAIRETFEEVGLRLDRARPARQPRRRDPPHPGPPSDRRPTVRLFALRSSVPHPQSAKSPRCAWVPLDHLLHPETYHSARIDIRGAPRDVPAYRFEEAIVWGMTERILTDLLDQLRP